MSYIQHIKRLHLLAVLLLGVVLHINAQVNNTRLKTQLADYFKNYTNTAYTNNQKYALDRVLTSESGRTVDVYANEVFGMQPFTPALVDEIIEKIRLRLPAPYNSYTLNIYAGNKNICELITAAWTNVMGERRHWDKVEYRGIPWVSNLSQAGQANAGLRGRHLSLWASHGKVYSNGEHKWIWQRPRLFCTTEDLLTQSIAVPFLYPMLERAGAIVFTPRERDWQRREVVVDNDFPTQNGSYTEEMGLYEWETHKTGFSNIHTILTDFDDPHHEGNARIIPAQNSSRQSSSATWTPIIPQDGAYAVYVTYPVLPNAVPDALYTVVHSGIKTQIRVNQQMGGSTWVYLGTFDFKAGETADNRIILSNVSNYRGYVGADAIRLGGGMSNIQRADIKKSIVTQLAVLPGDTTGFRIEAGSVVKPNGQIVPPRTGFVEHFDSLYLSTDTTVQILQYNHINDLIGSNLPRHLEAARYTAQWMGLQRERFSVKDGTYDYGDDINARPIATNYMARGSVYLPGDSGLCVPLELNLALHSDAGYRRGNEIIGSLGIYTTDVDEGKMPGGQSRLASRDFADILLQQVTKDMNRTFGQWTRRQMYDRNYGETRIPRIPSAILEMFSHQNYFDMLHALDPHFKFQLARSIYKGILRFVTLQHAGAQAMSINPIVAPLPVSHFSAEADAINHRIHLSWLPTIDSLETTATPTSYIVYRSTKDKGWDNGTLVSETSFDFIPDDSLLYRFRVEAVNEGGRSMVSETLCARLTNTPSVPSILIMNGFQRVAGPQAVCTTDSCGFDMSRDPGVPYIHTTEFCGNQLYFAWDGIGKETSKGMGYSGSELEGLLIKGNTFDYPVLHAEDFLLYGDYNISSCSRSALEDGQVSAGAYTLLDIIMGAQREDGYSSLHYKTFTPALQQLLKTFTESGGSLLVSGAYIASDMTSPAEQAFTKDVLHYQAGTSVKSSAGLLRIEGMSTACTYVLRPNEQRLSTAYVSALTPDNRSFATLAYILPSAEKAVQTQASVGQANAEAGVQGENSAEPAPIRTCAATAYKGADYNCIAVGFPIEQIQEDAVRTNLMHGFLQFLLTKQITEP